jgi:hypothetical protein
MDEALTAKKSERTATGVGYRPGYYGRAWSRGSAIVPNRKLLQVSRYLFRPVFLVFTEERCPDAAFANFPASRGSPLRGLWSGLFGCSAVRTVNQARHRRGSLSKSRGCLDQRINPGARWRLENDLRPAMVSSLRDTSFPACTGLLRT